MNFSGHPKHGTATYINQNWHPRHVSIIEGNEHLIGMRLSNLSIFNIYKPPSENWSSQVLPTSNHPAVYIDDFNSHSTEWGYRSDNDDEEKLSNWVNINHMHIIYDAKQGSTFNSGRWGTTTSLDLCFVTNGTPLSAQRRITNTFLKSQHRSVILDVGLVLLRINKPEMKRWNLRKADWNVYSTYVEENINRIESIPENYHRFVKLLKTAAGKSMLRGHRENYIPYFKKECEKLLNEYEQVGSEVMANRLLGLLDEERKRRWQTAMDELDFTYSSRKSWALLRKLGVTQPTRKENCVNANAISANLYKISNIKPSKMETIRTKRLYKIALDNSVDKSEIVTNYTTDEINAVLLKIKNRKAAGTDGILPELLKNLGIKGKTWLANLCSSIVNKCKIPKEWHEAKIIAILKPNKPGNDSKSYRPISLLSVV